MSAFSLRAAAEQAPARLALAEGERRVDYAALESLVGAELARLASAGLDFPGAPERVAFTPRRTIASLAMLLALFERGRPVLLVHERWSEEERARALVLAGPTFDADALAARPAPAACCPGVWPRTPDDARPMAIVYSSGSGGVPKPLVLSREGLLAGVRASAARLGHGAEDRWLLALPLAHVGGLALVLRALAARAGVVLLERFEPRALAESLERERVSFVSLVPAMLAALFRALPAWRPPPSLRALLLGGAAAPAALLDEARARGVPIARTWGMSEAGSQLATATPDDHAPGLPPLPGVALRVRDADAGGVGRLAVATPALAWGRLDEGPLALDESGFFETGDLGRLDESGRVHVLGRADALIVTGGEKVFPGEVEEALRAAPGVEDALVFGVEDEVFGERVAAALLAPEEALEGLAAHVDARLARYKRPRALALFARFPTRGPGKTDRSALIAAAYERLVPFPARAPAGRAFDAQRGEAFATMEVMSEGAPIPLPPEALDELRRARGLLVGQSLAIRVANAAGRPLEASLRLLPSGATRLVTRATRRALERALAFAIATMSSGKSDRGSRDRTHSFAAATSGALGGFFGLAGLAAELPVTTVIMMRSIGDIARSEGADLDDPAVRLACLEVLALGGPGAGDDAADTGYYAVRTALGKMLSDAAEHIARYGMAAEGAPVLVRLVERIAARFGVVVQEKTLLGAMPLVSSVTGALINTIFIEHFQERARGHFIVRRLEETHGADNVRAAWVKLATGELD